VSLSGFDRRLLQRCLESAPGAWQDFVDRYLGLVIHVADHTAQARGQMLDASTREDMVAEVFLTLIANDYAVLRRFQRNCSLATYLTVIARRVVVRKLMVLSRAPATGGIPDAIEESPLSRIENRDEVQRLLLRLDANEANVVRMYHLEGKSYEEIGQAIGLSTNSIGPMLSRARDKMRGDTVER